ncbi:MAG: molybdopterin molybdotransferase MoeA [Acidimicrobiaceae bacterium]|jgi:molybdopterin molybdotransferase|nr:molybdopterin molybdotransferase MoeA [Acidimicrobiaceae bacterium]
MIPLHEAQAYVLAGCSPLDTTTTTATNALGLVTGEPINCNEFVPPFNNTAVDGYAVMAADTAAAPVNLQVVGAIAAGETPSTPLTPGTAIRIMTGAPLPEGADAIVMVEETTTNDDATVVTIHTGVEAGAAVRRAGEDMQPGQQAFDSGTLLQPGHLGVLATLGIESIATHRRPLVGVISTGDELVEGPQPLAPGQIRDSNRRTLLSMVTQSGCTAVDLGLIRDDEDAVEAALRSGAEQCDAIITSGGVSMGDFDYVKLVLSRIADMRWMQIAIKPAKPMAFGTLDGTPVFGLPGNPVSSMVSYELLARPGLRKLLGLTGDALHRPRIRATAEESLSRRPDGKTHFARVKLRWIDGTPLIKSAGGQGSHQLSAMAGADALAVLPDGNGLAPGETAEIIVLHGD